MLGARVCAHTSFTSSQSSCPSISSSRFLLFHPDALYFGGCHRRGAGLALDRSAAASSGIARRGGSCEGGRPRGWPGLSRAPARTPPISEEPLRGVGGWGNRLLAVTDDAEGVAMMGRNHAPRRGEVNISPTGKGLLACG